MKNLVVLAMGTLLAATACFSSELEYNDPDKDINATVNRRIIRNLEEQTRVCMSFSQKQMLKQGMRNTEQIVDQSVIICGKSFISFVGRDPNVGNKKAILMAMAMAYEELSNIPGVDLPRTAR